MVRFKPDEQTEKLPRLFQQANVVLVPLGLLAVLFIMMMRPELANYALPSRFWLDANHFLLGALTVVAGAFCLSQLWRRQESMAFFKTLRVLLAVFLCCSMISGFLMLMQFQLIDSVTRIAYTVFDISVTGIVFALLAALVVHTARQIRSV